MKRSALFLLLLGCALAAYGYNPPAGGEEWWELVSPGFLGGGLDLTRGDAILGDAANPAVFGARDQAFASAYYGSLLGPDSSDDEQLGHIVSGAAHFPTQIGVLGLNLLYLDARLDGMDLGRLGRARASYARDLFPQVLVGAAANVMFGEQENTAFGVSADLGVVHTPGRLLGMDDFRWGVTAHTLGIGYRPHEEDNDGDDLTGFPSILTPGIGVSGVPYNGERISLGIAAWAQTPRFQNLRTGGGLTVTYEEFLSFDLGMRWDLQQNLGSDADESRSIIPSFGVTVNISRLIERRRDRSGSRDGDIRSSIAFAPLTGDVFALGVGVEVPFGGVDREPPEIDLGPVDTEWISPNNDGILDDLVVPFTIVDESAIEGFAFVVENEAGEVVRRIENKDNPPELTFDALVEEIRAGETGITVPESVRWDGLDGAGAIVDDGVYTYYIESWDIVGNRGIGDAIVVTVDTVAPELVVVDPDTAVFSPNGDGNQDTLIVEQSGTAEISIRAAIVDAEGVPVRAFEFDDREPEAITWDGLDDTGVEASDGVYQYQIESVDAAGNAAQRLLPGLILNRETQSVFVTVDPGAFSPNGDGQLEFAEFSLLLPQQEGLESWRFEILDEDETVVRTYEGGQTSEEQIRWNGTDEAGERRDGRYQGRLTAQYANGGRPSSDSRSILVDTSAPDVTMTIAPQPFSPDNDGFADELVIDLGVEDLSGVASWELFVDDPRGGVFKTVAGRGQPGSRLIWDGRSDDGVLVEAAEDYPWRLTIVDNVGLVTERTGEIPVDVLVIREGDRYKIRISNIVFAPNSPEFLASDEEVLGKNFEIVNRIAEILDRYRAYNVQIEGHAVNLSGTEREQVDELVPLSEARARTVLQALVERGLDEDRFTAVGVGGSQPIVPHTDTENRWRNRRVEFILIR